MLDQSGFENTIDWYIATIEKQAAIGIAYEKSGTPFPVAGGAGIHIYRILQEALNNVVRHSGAREAWVRLRFRETGLGLEVEDHGKGFVAQSATQGIGLVAMRERAELLRGTIEFVHPPHGGTLVRLTVPKSSVSANERPDADGE